MASALSGISLLLAALSQAAHPDEVAAALVAGPGAAYQAGSAAILWRNGDSLVVLGLHGHPTSEVEGLTSISLADDYPLVRCLWEGEALVESNDDATSTYSGLHRSGSRWHGVTARMPGGTTVSAPIIGNGQPLGAYSMNCASSSPWTSLDIAVLDMVSSALGLWLSHPDSGLPLPDAASIAVDAPLSPRQRAILGLVASGRTNPAIAAQLGVSVSTVKQDLTRAMAHLDAADRGEAAEVARGLGLLVDE